MNTLSFGVGISTSADPAADPVAAAQTAERLGFDFVSASDHPCGSHPTYETWTMLAWIAASTQRIMLASRVLGVPFRAPAMVAKMAQSLDQLCGGRLILGLGAGASDAEFRGFGLPVRSAGEKIDGLDDAARIIRGLWTERHFTYTGRVYHTDAAELEPKPERRIPIWMGTFGNRALGVTGRLADGWIPSLGHAPADQLPGMRARVLSAAEAAGRQPEDIVCALNVHLRLDDSRPRADPPTPGLLGGPVDDVAEQLAGFVAGGFTAFNFVPSGPDTAEQVQRIATELVPAVRSATTTSLMRRSNVSDQ